MAVTLSEFCKRLSNVRNLTNAKKAVGILWWHDKEEPGCRLSAAALAQLLREHGLGNPPSTTLRGDILDLKVAYSRRDGFRLREGKKDEVESWIAPALGERPVEVPADQAFLPEPFWVGTRGYIERVCVQLNGCYHCGFYDSSCVMIRRLIETLIIEAYEHLGRSDEIQDANGNYLPLSDLIDAAVAPRGLPLGRETKRALKDVKKLGDRSAHNRRYNARKNDVEPLREGLRLATEDLVSLAALQKH